jgi:hypothetical protein
MGIRHRWDDLSADRAIASALLQYWMLILSQRNPKLIR